MSSICINRGRSSGLPPGLKPHRFRNTKNQFWSNTGRSAVSASSSRGKTRSGPPGILSAKPGPRPGFGPQRKPLGAVGGPRTGFVGYVDCQRLDALYRSHEALLFCGEEDFGIVPPEAIGRGCPVVALARGGALETVEPGRSGVMFEEATVAAVIDAIGQARATAWDPKAMLASAQRFGARRFRDEITGWLGIS